MADPPIFLAGIDRSGIGLLGELLEGHPDVAITRRINFWEFYADRFGDLSDPARLDACLSDMMRYTRIRRLQLDFGRIRAEFLEGEATYPRLFRLLQEQNMQRLGKQRWGDKSLGAEGHAEKILSAFGDAVMLHVVRDPRDRYASQATHRSAGRGGPGSGTAAWLWSARLARRHSRRHPGRYLPLRYEDLVTRPDATLGSVCEFVGIDFDPLMFQFWDQESNTRRPVQLHTGSIGRFRRDLSPGDIRFIERAAGSEMSRWGYEPEGVDWSAGEKLQYAATTLPTALAGRVLWGPWKVAKDSLGSRPSPRRTVSSR